MSRGKGLILERVAEFRECKAGAREVARIAGQVLLLAILGSGTTVKAADAPAPAAETAADSGERNAEARRAYDRGRENYANGRYLEAIEAFEIAYRLSSLPAHLFNLAQSYRLSGNCAKALDAYRRFVPMTSDSKYRTAAEDHIDALAAECNASDDVPARAPIGAQAPNLAATPPRPQEISKAGLAPRVTSGQHPQRTKSRLSTVRLSLLAGGIAAGMTAGSIFLWNEQRYSTWSSENRALAAADEGATIADRVQRQEANDALFRSVKNVDIWTIGVAGLSAACLMGATAMTLLIPLEGFAVRASEDRMVLGWSASWY